MKMKNCCKSLGWWKMNNELYNLFIQNKTIRPVILIGNYNKNTNYPKKKINTLKIYNPTDTNLFNISKLYVNKLQYNISDINFCLLIIIDNQSIITF